MVATAATRESKREIEKKYTLEEYFKREEKATRKSEFHNGKIIPMAGGTYNHSVLSGAFHAILFMMFLNSEEEAYILNSDYNIYVPKFDKAVYTDTFAVVGKKEFQQNSNRAVVNPTLIVEVASKSTERYDRSGKFRMYQSLPSFQEYVIANQDAPIVEVFYKISENEWKVTHYVGLDKTVKLISLNVELKMADLYRKVEDLQDPQTAIDFPEEEE